MITLLLVGGACSRDDEPVRAEVQRLSLAEGDEARAQSERVARHGRRALPAIEAVMHTADERGRKNLVVTLRRIGDEEAVPLLLHIAAYDAAQPVRGEAESTLRGWAEGTGTRADRARAALRRLEELHSREAAG